MARIRVVVLGGTFDRLHIGHEALLSAAFELGSRVGIGLTTSEFLQRRGKPLARLIAPYPVRRRALAAWLRRRYPGRTWWIASLSDGLGRSIERGVDAIVVSADTADGGREVNRERRRRGLPPVRVFEVPLVLADDFQPVSSRRIRAGIIDRDGRRLSAVVVRACAPPPARASVRAALKAVYRRPVIRWTRPDGEISSSQKAVEARRPSEIELDLRGGTPPGNPWMLDIRAGPIRLPALRLRGGDPPRLERDIATRLRPALQYSRSVGEPQKRRARKNP